jgi:protein-S-isoprenylcysteine O-methyltransferase Ste14
LGHYFTFTVMTSANQPVITTGPYRVLRHPSYAGILLVLAGIGLSYGNWHHGGRDGMGGPIQH